jgi:hypothetical protein
MENTMMNQLLHKMRCRPTGRTTHDKKKITQKKNTTKTPKRRFRKRMKEEKEVEVHAVEAVVISTFLIRHN